MTSRSSWLWLLLAIPSFFLIEGCGGGDGGDEGEDEGGTMAPAATAAPVVVEDKFAKNILLCAGANIAMEGMMSPEPAYEGNEEYTTCGPGPTHCGKYFPFEEGLAQWTNIKGMISNMMGMQGMDVDTYINPDAEYVVANVGSALGCAVKAKEVFEAGSIPVAAYTYMNMEQNGPFSGACHLWCKPDCGDIKMGPFMCGEAGPCQKEFPVHRGASGFTPDDDGISSLTECPVGWPLEIAVGGDTTAAP